VEEGVSVTAIVQDADEKRQRGEFGKGQTPCSPC